MQLRIRTIKPEFFKHETLFDLEKETGLPIRLAWAGLFAVADREGRFPWRPRTIKSEILPYDDGVDFSKILDILKRAKMIVQYEVNGERFGWIPSFGHHQSINNRETKSDLPPHPNEREILASLTRRSRVDDAPSGEGKGIEGNGIEGGAASETPPPPPADLPAMGPVHQEIAGNSVRELVLAQVPMTLQEEWVDRYDPKWLKDALNLAICTHAGGNPPELVKDWPTKLTKWFLIEKKPKYRRPPATISALDPPKKPHVTPFDPNEKGLGMSVDEALKLAKQPEAR